MTRLMKMATCPKCRSVDIRVYKETKNSVVNTVFIYNWCGCKLGASKERYVQYAYKYTEQVIMTDHIKDSHTATFTGLTGCGKNHLVLDLIEEEYNMHFNSTVIISPTL